MTDQYYANGQKYTLQRRDGIFTIGLSDPSTLDDMVDLFDQGGYGTKKIPVKDKFLVSGPDDLTAEELRDQVTFDEAPYITQAYSYDITGLLLHDEVLVSGIELKKAKMKKFKKEYDLELVKALKSGGYIFSVNNPDDTRVLEVCCSIYEDEGASATPRFTRISSKKRDKSSLDKFFDF